MARRVARRQHETPSREDQLRAFLQANAGKLHELRAQVLRAQAEQSLAHFIRQAWHVVEPATPYSHNWHIDAICEHLQAVTRGDIRRLVINMPPRHMKSLAAAVFWPCWAWTTRPETRWLFASYAQSLSVRDSLKCRRLIRSDWYQRNWGRVFELVSDQNAKVRFENDRTGYRLATSVDGTATGEGGSVVVVDDPHSVREADSDAVREATLEWWDQVMSTRLNDPKRGALVVIMQRVHERDLSGHVLEQGGYIHLKLPAEWEGETHYSTASPTPHLSVRDPRDSYGDLLWPERVGREELDELKTRLGTYGTAGQLQQRPAPEEGGIFNKNWWQRYDAPPLRFDRIVSSWDTAVAVGQENAFTVGQVWGETINGIYLLDQYRARVEFPDLLAAIKAQHLQWHAHAVLVEDKSSGASAVQSLRRETLLPILPVKTGMRDKVVRARAVSPLVESGKVYVPNKARWLDEWWTEVHNFPNSAFADQVDAMTQALEYLTQSRGLTTGMDLS